MVARKFDSKQLLVLSLVMICSTSLMSKQTLAKDQKKKRPNILFIFTDDHASHAISSFGSKINQTPNLDRIANEGMIFANCFCTNSLCGPSRAVILTGKHSHINGFRQNGNRFNAAQQTFPKLLKKVGYQTAVVGKWHLGTDPTGFNYWQVLRGQGPYYNPNMKEIGNPQGVKHIGYTTDIITDIALDFLKNKREKDKPFMLMYQHKAPHRNWQPGPKYLHMYDDVTIPEPATLFDNYEGRGTAAKQQDMTIAKTLNANDLKLTPPRNLTPEQLKVWNAAYKPKNKAFREANLKGKDLVRWKYQRYIKDYLRSIASVDDNVGRVLKYLDDSGLAANTIVIYSSDQGFYLGDHGWFDKRFMYEESYRMPFMVRWPGKVKPGSVNHDLVSNLDFAETFLGIAGVEIPGDMQGKSFTSLMTAKNPLSRKWNEAQKRYAALGGNALAQDVARKYTPGWRNSLYYHYYEFHGDRRTSHMVRRHYGVRTKRFKLIHFYNLDEWELYDLEKDPQEMKSEYSNPAYAGIVKELTGEVKKLQKQFNVSDDTGSVLKNPPVLKPGFKRNKARKSKKRKR